MLDAREEVGWVIIRNNEANTITIGLKLKSVSFR